VNSAYNNDETHISELYDENFNMFCTPRLYTEKKLASPWGKKVLKGGRRKKLRTKKQKGTHCALSVPLFTPGVI